MLAGVPVYYVTNRDEQAKLPFLMSAYFTALIIAAGFDSGDPDLVGSRISRFFGRPVPAGDGWQAVSQGDEVEMVDNSRVTI